MQRHIPGVSLREYSKILLSSTTYESQMDLLSSPWTHRSRLQPPDYYIALKRSIMIHNRKRSKTALFNTIATSLVELQST